MIPNPIFFYYVMLPPKCPVRNIANLVFLLHFLTILEEIFNTSEIIRYFHSLKCYSYLACLSAIFPLNFFLKYAFPNIVCIFLNNTSCSFPGWLWPQSSNDTKPMFSPWQHQEINVLWILFTARFSLYLNSQNVRSEDTWKNKYAFYTFALRYLRILEYSKYH